MKTIIWIWSTWYGARTVNIDQQPQGQRRTYTMAFQLSSQMNNARAIVAMNGITGIQMIIFSAHGGRDEMDELNEKIKRVFADLNIRCAYNMPSFWADGGKDYVVIPTRYAKGYQKALEDAEREITEVLSEQPEIIRCKDCKWCEDADGLMCKNPASWVVATDYDFGCVCAERRQDE